MRALVLVLLAICGLLTGCKTISWPPDVFKPHPPADSVVTNVVDNPLTNVVVTPPTVTTALRLDGSYTTPDYCGNLPGSRPSIALDSLGQPHIVTDEDSNKRLYIFHKLNGIWSSSVLAEGRPGVYDAGRLYLPCIEIDALDRAWISCKFGCKEWGTMLGQGLWCYDSVSSAPSQRFFTYVSASVTHKGNGNIALDPFKPDEGVVLATDGNYAVVNADGLITYNAKMGARGSGEKIRFRITPRAGKAGVWHVVMCGYSEYPSAYQSSLRHIKGQKAVVWADYARYPEQGDDFHHPGVTGDVKQPELAYMACIFNTGLVYNVYDGAGMVFPADSLPVVDIGASFRGRLPPALASAKGALGGAYLAWEHDKRIMVCFISQDGEWYHPVTGAYRQYQATVAGRNPTICTGVDGSVHMAYYDGSGMRYVMFKAVKE